MGAFIVTIWIRLILYTSYIASIISPLSPFPIPLKAIARGFLVLFHIGLWSPSTIYCHLNLLPSPPPLTSSPHCACFTILFFAINIWVDVQRGVSMELPSSLQIHEITPFIFSNSYYVRCKLREGCTMFLTLITMISEMNLMHPNDVRGLRIVRSERRRQKML
jgi:hypothetical protein